MTTKRTNKPARIWVGIIPEIFGYGINAIGRTEAEAMDALRSAYADWKVARPDSSTDFDSSYERFGGSVTRVEIGKAYHDGFRS